ncbi:YciI family protein [Nocardioides humi]|uniref:YciI family protein n=1 Tax=Nocardioides humi TaxID=449461 RepID=A0ABN2ACG8_9ACTN|nr:YciI family protein [Nocardioides humi]
MTRYMGLIRMEEGITAAPPQPLIDAMDEFIAKTTANGNYLDGAGLFGTEDAVNFVIRGGETTRVDGPYAEAKEVVGGWALLQFDSQDAAVESMREMAQLHADHWPELDFVLTLRQVAEAPPQAD